MRDGVSLNSHRSEILIWSSSRERPGCSIAELLDPLNVNSNSAFWADIVAHIWHKPAALPQKQKCHRLCHSQLPHLSTAEKPSPSSTEASAPSVIKVAVAAFAVAAFCPIVLPQLRQAAKHGPTAFSLQPEMWSSDFQNFRNSKHQMPASGYQIMPYFPKFSGNLYKSHKSSSWSAATTAGVPSCNKGQTVAWNSLRIAQP